MKRIISFPTARRLAPRLPLAAIVLLIGGSFSPSHAQLREHVGKHLTLHTDLPASEAIEQLPDAFDAAVPQWCEYFGVDQDIVEGWHVTGYLMSNKQVFAQRGLVPSELPDFEHGYQWGDKIWVVGQASEYYTRHLVLHEGVHSAMWRFFGGAGPAWFMEGTAELLATHHWSDGKMTINVMPDTREAFPFWGRLKVIESARRADRALAFDSIMRYSQKAHRQVEPYAWSWAALTLLEMYPEYRSIAIQAARRGSDSSIEFTRRFYDDLKSEWPELSTRWTMLVDGLEYGFDRTRNRIDLNVSSDNSQAIASAPTSQSYSIKADHGWQATHFRVASGQTIQITASGEYTIGNDPKPWVCQPQGVTIDYHRGNPLGMVLAAVAPANSTDGTKLSLPQIVGVGRERTFQAAHDGLLLIRIGDHPSSLADNQGSATVNVSTGKQP
ncbi:MAG: hypothetical protein R3C05_27795 [Pirellulaceae bacterium]